MPFTSLCQQEFRLPHIMLWRIVFTILESSTLTEIGFLSKLCKSLFGYFDMVIRNFYSAVPNLLTKIKKYIYSKQLSICGKIRFGIFNFWKFYNRLSKTKCYFPANNKPSKKLEETVFLVAIVILVCAIPRRIKV